MIRAKFYCASITTRGWYGKAQNELVELTAVYSTDPDDPNKTWSEATPSGSLTMTITNPEALGKFKPGVDYFIDFTEAAPPSLDN